MERFPSAFGMMLCAVDEHLAGTRLIVLAGPRDDAGMRAFLRALRDSYDPNSVLALADPGVAGAERALPVLAGKSPIEGRSAAYVCEAGTCRAPVLSPAELEI